MKVGIDARLVTYRRGIGNIVYNLLTALAEQSSSVEFYLYVDNPQAAQYVPVNPRFKLKLLYPNLYPVWEQVLLPLQVKRDELDVLYCPANTAPLGLSKSTRLVLTIADVMYMLPSSVMPVSPSLYQRVGRQYLKNIVPHVVHQAAAVTTISNYSKADIVKHLHLDPASIYVVPPAPGSAFNKLNNSSLLYATKVKFGITERMVLALGAMDPRKNTARVIESFANYIAQFKSSMQLVVAGLSSNGRE